MSSVRPTVTAIVVAHDGARWLPETLRAVLGQTRRPDRIIGVDNGSHDGSARLLADALGQGAVLTLPRSAGFGEAVAAVLDRLPPVPGEWLWPLHDDCAPDPRALAALLAAAAADPQAAVLGPKLRDRLDRRLLLEVGVAVDRSGRRDTGLEPREYDQGQHDGPPRRVPAVSTAGMLIRRDVWTEIGGLDPALPLFGDDIDLCWRVHAAGHRVVNVTAAVAYHAEAAARRRRKIALSDEHPRRFARRAGLLVVLANLPLGRLPWAVLRTVVVATVRTLLFLAAKQPANAWDEVAVVGAVLGRPLRLLRARRGRRQAYRRLAPMLPPPSAAYRRFVDMVRDHFADRGPIEAAGRHHAGGAGRGAEEGEELLDDTGGLLQRIFGNPGTLLFLALLAVALVAERRVLLGDGLLGGGALVPVVGGAADLWDLYLADFHPVGLGSDAWAPPYVAVLAALSTLFLGKVWLAVAVLLLGCVPLAGLSAYLATRFMIPDRGTRVWLAATYALLPTATGTVAGGRVGTAVVLILLPVYAALARVVLSGDGRRARRAAWGLGLLLAVGTAFVPLVYPLTALLGALAAAAFGGLRRGVRTSLAIALAVPLVLLAPWLAGFRDAPGRLLLEVGLTDPALSDPALPAAALLTLVPGGPGTPPPWAMAGLPAVALAALLLRREQLITAIGWGVMVFGVLVATVVSRIAVDGAPVWPGVPLTFAATALLVASALTAPRLGELRRAGGVRRIAALLVAAVAFSTPVACAGLWITGGVSGPLRHDLTEALPALAVSGAAPGEGTLLLRERDGALGYTVLRGRTLLIGEADLPPAAPAAARLAGAVAGLAAGRGGDDVATLASLGIRFVLVPPPVAPALQRALDAEPGLLRVTLGPVGGLWQVVGPVGLPWPEPAPGGDPWHRGWLWAQGALVVLCVALAAPAARLREPDPGPEPAAEPGGEPGAEPDAGEPEAAVPAAAPQEAAAR